MRVLLLSAYAADSHRQWQRGLCRLFDDHQWTVLSLPARHFAWRIRGNPLSWLNEPALMESHDRVLATSMVDLATVRGLWPGLAGTPACLYLHENQFAYPLTDQAHASLEPKMVQLYAALSAERLVFNSHYNLETFLHGVTALVSGFPDHVPRGLSERLASRARVVPVGIDPQVFGSQRAVHQPLRLVWNHRWEYDKAPERLLGLLEVLLARQVAFRIDILGRGFRRRPPAFDRIKDRFGQHLDCFGYVADPVEYHQRLARADVVLSTALHDFQGLAVLEAVAAGCRPLVPDRLAYPELFDEAYRYASFPDQPEREAQAMADRLLALVRRPSPSVDHLAWGRLKNAYAEVLFNPCEPEGNKDCSKDSLTD